MSMRHTDSAAWIAGGAKLSVLIPFYRDDPTALLDALGALPLAEACEVILYDDGTDDAAQTAAVANAVKDSPVAARFITNPMNQGRAAARNALQNAARADWVLFLDADMRPESDSFLKLYLEQIVANTADVIFGGFDVVALSDDPDRDLHRALSKVSDCLSLSERAAAGPQYVASSNLCVRKAVLSAEPFDDGFSGWGWEDSEWAARITKRFTLIHIDNPAIHLGLETTETLLQRFATSGSNYRRFTDLHPDLAPSLTLFRLSKKLRHVPAQSVMRPVLRSLVRSHIVPVKLRLNALKLWRASHYAEALS